MSETEDRLLDALHRIARLGANPITEQKCESRKSFIRLVDKMWTVAVDAIKETEEERIRATSVSGSIADS